MDVYIVISSDPHQVLRKRRLDVKKIESLDSLKLEIQRIFNIRKENVILGVYDENIRDFYLAEKDEDVIGQSRFKIFYNQISLIVILTENPTYEKKSYNISSEEYDLRVQLAAAYRLFELYGWTDLIYNHLTVALPVPDESKKLFLINPFGVLFNEITASSLVTIDLDGNIVNSGSTKFGINKAGYVIHSAIHNGREDIKCIMHCHSNAGTAVSCMKDGLLNICQNAAILGPVSYHDYEGLAVNMDERERIVKDMGPKNKNMILRSHGILTCGSSIAEAFFQMFMLNKCCEIQVAALSVGRENLIFPNESVQNFTKDEAANFNVEGIGQKEFNALMRKLDSIDPSYRL